VLSAPHQAMKWTSTNREPRTALSLAGRQPQSRQSRVVAVYQQEVRRYTPTIGPGPCAVYARGRELAGTSGDAGARCLGASVNETPRP